MHTTAIDAAASQVCFHGHLGKAGAARNQIS